MPGWIVDVGRYVGGIVVFSLCALFSAIALAPCVLLYDAIAARSSTFWAVLSVPFLYLLWGWTYLILTAIYKRVIFYKPRVGEFPLFSWPIVGWGTTGALQMWGNHMFLIHFRGTAMMNIYFRMMGVKIGRRVTINTLDIYDWDMITLDDDCILGGACAVLGHIVENGKVKMRPVYIGKRALIGTAARVMPGCTIEDNAVLAAGAYMKKGARIEANSLYGGMPAKFIRMRGDVDAHDDGVAKS